MQNMIHAGVFPGPLHGDHVPGFSHDANQTVVALLVVTDGAKVPIRQILAHRAGMHLRPGVQDRLGEFLGVLPGHAQGVQRQPLGAFCADAGEARKLLRQPLQSGG